MKFNDPFPSARAFKTLLCSTSNKGRLICKHLTQSAVVYSVGSDCTNLSTQESMLDYSFSQSEADTIFISAWADSADTDIYVAAAAISQKLPGLLCIRRKQATILCRNIVPEEMADCYIASLDVMPAKWKAMKKSFIRLPPDVDSLRQHIAFVRTTWLIWCITPP